jgi:hypothetical protein
MLLQVLPVVHVTKVSTNQNQITKGSSVLVYVDIYVQPNTVDIYSLQVTTTTSLSTICDIRIVSKGSNFPCNDILEVDNTTSYTSLDGNLTFSMVTRDIGLITSMSNEIDIMDVDNKVRAIYRMKVFLYFVLFCVLFFFLSILCPFGFL